MGPGIQDWASGAHRGWAIAAEAGPLASRQLYPEPKVLSGPFQNSSAHQSRLGPGVGAGALRCRTLAWFSLSYLGRIWGITKTGVYDLQCPGR